jgi:hypothetical protein
MYFYGFIYSILYIIFEGCILCNYLYVVFLPFIMMPVTNHHFILSLLLCFLCEEQSYKNHVVPLVVFLLHFVFIFF